MVTVERLARLGVKPELSRSQVKGVIFPPALYNMAAQLTHVPPVTEAYRPLTIHAVTPEWLPKTWRTSEILVTRSHCFSVTRKNRSFVLSLRSDLKYIAPGPHLMAFSRTYGVMIDVVTTSDITSLIRIVGLTAHFRPHTLYHDFTDMMQHKYPKIVVK